MGQILRAKAHLPSSSVIIGLRVGYQDVKSFVLPHYGSSNQNGSWAHARIQMLRKHKGKEENGRERVQGPKINKQ